MLFHTQLTVSTQDTPLPLSVDVWSEMPGKRHKSLCVRAGLAAARVDLPFIARFVVVHKRARIYDSILSCASRVSVFKLALGGDHRRTRRALDSQFSACLTTLHCRVTVLSPLRPPYSLHTCDDTSCCCNQSVSSCAIGPIQLCSVAKSNLTVVCVLNLKAKVSKL